MIPEEHYVAGKNPGAGNVICYRIFPLAPPIPVPPVPGLALRFRAPWVSSPAAVPEVLPVLSVLSVAPLLSRGPLPLSTVGWVEGAWVGAEVGWVAAVVGMVVGAVVVLGVSPGFALLRQPAAIAITSTSAGISIKRFFIVITSIVIGFEPIISRKTGFTLVNMTTCIR